MNHISECVRRVTGAVQQLRSIVQCCSTFDVVEACRIFHLEKGNDPKFETHLSSPAKQCSFLLGVLLESPEPGIRKDFTEEDWKKVEHLLEEAFSAYLPLYFPDSEELGTLTKEWYWIRRVVMPTFLHFFNTGLLASAEQVAARIRRYLAPFDNNLSQALGINASQAVDICEWIANRLQDDLDRLEAICREEESARLALLDEAKSQGWSLDDLRSATKTSGYPGLFDKLTAALPSLGKLQYADLVAAFPGVGERFWKLFSVGRGEGLVISYPTERSIADERPLIRLSDTEAICPLVNSLFSAVLLVGEQTLSTGEERDTYFRARDKTFEGECAEHFRRILGSQAESYSKIFETPDLGSVPLLP